MNQPSFVNDPFATNGKGLTTILEPETKPTTPKQNWQNSLNALPFPLKNQQTKALRKLWHFLASPETFFLLGGYAGTGKTTIIFAIIQELLHQGKRIALTAPTNKAVTILKKMATENGLGDIPCLTIHQLLGLGMVNRGAEKVLAQTSPSSVHLYDIIFLDECSMVGSELWEWIDRCFAGHLLSRRKLILMGDPAQLNPVGEKRSPTFTVRNRAILTEVVRQAGESPLLEFVTTARKAVKSRSDLFVPFAHYRSGDKSNGAFKVKEKTLLKYAVKTIQRHFEGNPDCFRILCYTNKRVQYYNQIIRAAVYGEDAPQFLPGERLITKKPVVAPDGKTVVLPTSCEITVTEVTTTKYYGYQVWKLKVKTDDGLMRQLFVLDQSEEQRYEAELASKYESALRNGCLWRKYYWWKDDVFAQVLNCFALTVHNSQGSTFEEGAVDSNDLFIRLLVGDKEESEQQKYREYHRLWYVAASRYRQRLLFLSPSQWKMRQVAFL
jgi:exodeoxyribonuclease-5